MEVSVDAAFGGAASEAEPRPGAARQPESAGTVSLQLLEFKTRLMEVVEELHIRRDAETRFEGQISKLVLEKQELEWEKESLAHQMDTVSKQHAASLTCVRNQFQAKLRSAEDEKGKHQVIAGLKDKEIGSLKDELKTLQLLKYNLEKKCSEVEQKLSLQSRWKDGHLNQLGEVEKRFSALSRQCAAVKQAHVKLEQNVDEAMRINRKLTAAHDKQEATVASLKKELDDVNNKLIKVKMSSVRYERTSSPAGREQQVQQLNHKLNMETEMNLKLQQENVSERAEKKELIRSLQHSQQLLLTQTQTVRRAELELQNQREKYQALKQEHEATQEKAARLAGSLAASRACWDKERTALLEDVRAVREAFQDLQRRRAALTKQAGPRAEPAMVSQSAAVPPPSKGSEEEAAGETGGGSASSRVRNPDAAPTEPETGGAAGGRPAERRDVTNLQKPTSVAPEDRPTERQEINESEEERKDDKETEEGSVETQRFGEDEDEDSSEGRAAGEVTGQPGAEPDDRAKTEAADGPQTAADTNGQTLPVVDSEDVWEPWDGPQGHGRPDEEDEASRDESEGQTVSREPESGRHPSPDSANRESRPVSDVETIAQETETNQTVETIQTGIPPEPLDASNEDMSQTDAAPSPDGGHGVQETTPTAGGEAVPARKPAEPEDDGADPRTCKERKSPSDVCEDGHVERPDVKSDGKKDAGDPRTTGSEADRKFGADSSREKRDNETHRPPLDAATASSPSCSMTDRFLLDGRTKPDGSVQGSPVPEPDAAGSGGPLLGPPASTLPSFLRNKRSKGSLAPGLLDASGTRRRGGQEADAETTTTTPAADTNNGTFQLSTAPWQTTAECSRAPPTAAHWELSSSQEREDQQSSFRARISRIEQFLNEERLRPPKRRRTDD